MEIIVVFIDEPNRLNHFVEPGFRANRGIQRPKLQHVGAQALDPSWSFSCLSQGRLKPIFRPMTYVISSGDPTFVLRYARTPSDALIIAEDLAQDGRSDVKVLTPQGETLPVRLFEVLVREQQVAA